jgi:hypothetical protein
MAAVRSCAKAVISSSGSSPRSPVARMPRQTTAGIPQSPAIATPMSSSEQPSTEAAAASRARRRSRPAPRSAASRRIAEFSVGRWAATSTSPRLRNMPQSCAVSGSAIPSREAASRACPAVSNESSISSLSPGERPRYCSNSNSALARSRTVLAPSSIIAWVALCTGRPVRL